MAQFWCQRFFNVIWNGINYPLFGFGEKIGALGIRETHIYGPKVGLLGIVPGVTFLSAYLGALCGAKRLKYHRVFIDLQYSGAILPAARMIG